MKEFDRWMADAGAARPAAWTPVDAVTSWQSHPVDAVKTSGVAMEPANEAAARAICDEMVPMPNITVTLRGLDKPMSYEQWYALSKRFRDDNPGVMTALNINSPI